MAVYKTEVLPTEEILRELQEISGKIIEVSPLADGKYQVSTTQELNEKEHAQVLGFFKRWEDLGLVEV